jgi:hypothetical protein
MDKHTCASFNAHHHNSVGFVVVVEWRVRSMFGCCFRNPVRLRCCSSQYLCPSLFTVNKLLTSCSFGGKAIWVFSRIAFWGQALFLISCFFFAKTPGKNRKTKLARISTGLIVRRLPFGVVRCSFQQQIS